MHICFSGKDWGTCLIFQDVHAATCTTSTAYSSTRDLKLDYTAVQMSTTNIPAIRRGETVANPRGAECMTNTSQAKWENASTKEKKVSRYRLQGDIVYDSETIWNKHTLVSL